MIKFEEHMNLVWKVYHQKFSKHVTCEYWKEELIQEGFLALHKAILNYNKDSKNRFSTYAYSIIWGNMNHLVRKTHHTKTAKALKGISLDMEIDEVGGSLSEVIADKMNYKEVDLFIDFDKAVNALPEKPRKVFIDMVYTGLTYQQIADKHGFSYRMLLYYKNRYKEYFKSELGVDINK